MVLHSSLFNPSLFIDEVLFHSAIHPEHIAKSLNPEQVASLHHNIVYVCQTAVDVNADHRQFPSHWLFPHRWVRLSILSRVVAKEVAGEGEGVVKFYTCRHLTFTFSREFHVFQPSGEKASIKWITVGGRTSAVVEQVQKLGGMGSTKKKRKRVAKVRSTLLLSDHPIDHETGRG